MKIYYSMNETRDVTAISTVFTDQTPLSAEFLNAIYPDKLDGYQIVNGTLEYSEDLYQSRQKAKQNAEAVKKAEDNIEYLKNKQFLDSLDDTDALTVSVLYPHWNGNGILYKAGNRIQYEENLFKVLKEHVSQKSWNPKDAPSLFAKVVIPESGHPVNWQQPDNTNPFMKGDQVVHADKIWESQIDNNIYEPGAEGIDDRYWKEVKNDD